MYILRSKMSFGNANVYVIPPCQVNPFVPMHPFSIPLKHQKTVRFYDIFGGIEKGCIGNKWVMQFDVIFTGKESLISL